MKYYIACAAFITAVWIAAPANAAALLADKIVISSAQTVPNLEYLQVGEVLALEAGSGIDVALATNGGVASATGSFSPDDGADKAIDGLFPAGYIGASYPGPYGIFHSAGNDGTETLTISFNPTDLGQIKIYGRADGGFQVRDLYHVTAYSGGNAVYTGILDARVPGFATASFAPIPEPATWAFLFLGFGAIGWTLRGNRRQQGAAAAA